jgi:hypothetical protein
MVLSQMSSNFIQHCVGTTYDDWVLVGDKGRGLFCSERLTGDDSSCRVSQHAEVPCEFLVTNLQVLLMRNVLVKVEGSAKAVEIVSAIQLQTPNTVVPLP